MRKTKNHAWFSLAFAMGIILSVSITIIYLLEYVMPFAKDTKGIEFSSNAYYQSNSAIENALFFVANNELGDESNDELNIWINSQSNQEKAVYTDLWFDIVARGNIIPPPGEGNSEYDPDWNRLSLGKPLQLEIWWDSWDTWNIEFRVPDTGIWRNIYLEPKPWGILAWQITSDDATLNSASSYDRVENETLKTGKISDFNINAKSGTKLEGESSSFQNFYETHCDDDTEKCTLKISIINNLELNNSNKTPLPYLEYRISGMQWAPLRYTRIRATWYSHGFQKDIYIKIPQQTVNEAFDFTVFQ